MIPVMLPVVQYIPPVPGVITQGYHMGHKAVDFACVTGTPVQAVHEGRVERFRDGRLGNQVRVYGPNGVVSLYAHLDSFGLNGNVNKGDVIGYCGNTGAWSTGPHLHFESNVPYKF